MATGAAVLDVAVVIGPLLFFFSRPPHHHDSFHHEFLPSRSFCKSWRRLRRDSSRSGQANNDCFCHHSASDQTTTKRSAGAQTYSGSSFIVPISVYPAVQLRCANDKCLDKMDTPRTSARTLSSHTSRIAQSCSRLLLAESLGVCSNTGSQFGRNGGRDLLVCRTCLGFM